MLMNSYYLTTLVTTIICMLIIGVSLIRLGLCGKKLRIQIKYTAIVLLALIAALQPYYLQYISGVAPLALASCIMLLLIDGAPALRFYKNETHEFETQIYDPHNWDD